MKSLIFLTICISIFITSELFANEIEIVWKIYDNDNKVKRTMVIEKNKKVDFQEGKNEIYSDGVLARLVIIKNGKMAYEKFYVYGIKQREINYKNGVQHGMEIHYHSNGQVSLKKNYINGVVEGFETAYFPDGKLDFKVNNIHGKQDGLYESYYKNGALCEKILYKNGKEMGEVISYYDNGDIYKVMNYSYGIRIAFL